MDTCFVFYDCWQMECCGKKFSVGDTVKWLIYKAERLNTPVDVGRIDYCYEAHSSDWHNLLVLEGKVEEIKILYEKFEPSKDDPRLLIPIDGKIIKAKTAKGFDRKLDGMEASGYIVLLDEYTIRPAKKDEVTYK